MKIVEIKAYTPLRWETLEIELKTFRELCTKEGCKGYLNCGDVRKYICDVEGNVARID